MLVVAPSANGIGADVEPEANAVPFTLMVALASVVTGATVIFDLVLGTISV